MGDREGDRLGLRGAREGESEGVLLALNGFTEGRRVEGDTEGEREGTAVGGTTREGESRTRPAPSARE